METTHRRTFLKAAGATAALSAFPNILFGAPATNAKLKIGLVGCGGRGTGAAQEALMADDNTVLWAIGDLFETQVPKALNNLKRFEGRLDVPQERQFSGLDAYMKVLESGVDVVLLATPPGFRPQHMRAAIEAGKHVFAEKPMAVDVAGVKSVMETARLAKEKGLTLQHGYCWRYDPGVREGYAKILSGELGRVLSLHLHRPARPEMGRCGMADPQLDGSRVALRRPAAGAVHPHGGQGFLGDGRCGSYCGPGRRRSHPARG
jgi:predicted dehydrogenase